MTPLVGRPLPRGILCRYHLCIACLRQLISGLRRGAGSRGETLAAITEQLLCASAATVVMCNRRGACACGRGLDSGFVSAIKFYRARMGLSVRSDVAGGIFSFK